MEQHTPTEMADVRVGDVLVRGPTSYFGEWNEIDDVAASDFIVRSGTVVCVVTRPVKTPCGHFDDLIFDVLIPVGRIVKVTSSYRSFGWKRSDEF